MKVLYAFAAMLMASVACPSMAAEVLSEKQISMALAHDVALAVVDQCRKDGFHVAATVVDRTGGIKVLIRDDGANPHTVEASQRKAYTAALFRVATGTFAERVRQPANAALTSLPNVIALQGGLPIKAGDEVIGAIGVGGAPGGDKDEVCAQAGIHKIADRLH